MRSAVRLWLYGIGMLVPAIYFAWRYPLRGNTDKLTDIGKMARYERDEFAWFVGGMAVLFGLYVLALWESRRLTTEQALPPVFGCGAGLATAMACMYPVNATDIFIYAVRSRLLTTYGVNPIAAYFRDYPGDPWTPFVQRQWAERLSPYGPLWNLMAAPSTWIAGDRIGVAVAGFKVLALLCLLLGGWVIVQTLAASSSASPATGAIFYIWNPLVLWEAVGNGHNDVVMTLPLLLVLLAWAKRWDSLVIPLLLVGALIKYVTVLLMPLAAIAVWRRAGSWRGRARLVGWSAVLSAIVLLISLFPFYDLRAVRNSIVQQGDLFAFSPAAMAVGLLRERYPPGEIRRWAMLLGEAILLAALAWQGIRLWKRPSRLPRASFEVIYVFLLVAAWYFRGWYLIWPVGLAALLPWGWPAWRMIAWTIGAMAGYGLFIFIEAWWQPGFNTVQNVGVPLMFGPTAAISLAELVWRHVLRRESGVEEATAG